MVRVYTEPDRLGDPWVELERGTYPWWRGASAEQALKSCLEGLGDREPIRAGVRHAARRAELERSDPARDPG